MAFDGWKKRPWNASLSFADFCEWLLPYRIGNETPDNWRQIYHDRYSFLLDEVYTGIDVVEAISVVWEYLQKEDPYRFTWVFNYPHLGGEYLLHNRIGKCQDACDFMIYVMRAIGVPVAYLLLSLPGSRNGEVSILTVGARAWFTAGVLADNGTWMAILCGTGPYRLLLRMCLQEKCRIIILIRIWNCR